MAFAKGTVGRISSLGATLNQITSKAFVGLRLHEIGFYGVPRLPTHRAHGFGGRKYVKSSKQPLDKYIFLNQLQIKVGDCLDLLAVFTLNVILSLSLTSKCQIFFPPYLNRDFSNILSVSVSEMIILKSIAHITFLYRYTSEAICWPSYLFIPTTHYM